MVGINFLSFRSTNLELILEAFTLTCSRPPALNYEIASGVFELPLKRKCPLISYKTERMKLFSYLIPASLAVAPYGYLTTDCVNNLCLECQKTKMVGAVKVTAIEYQNLREKTTTEITTALTKMGFFNGEERAQVQVITEPE